MCSTTAPTSTSTTPATCTADNRSLKNTNPRIAAIPPESVLITVTTDTLIPRPETELLVELALARIDPDAPARIADLGTGSGAIALALASERPAAAVVATDVDKATLAVAVRNAAAHGLDNVWFRRGDWTAALGGERFDLIASNPPYIAEGDPHLDGLRHIWRHLGADAVRGDLYSRHGVEIRLAGFRVDRHFLRDGVAVDGHMNAP